MAFISYQGIKIQRIDRPKHRYTIASFPKAKALYFILPFRKRWRSSCPELRANGKAFASVIAAELI